MVGAMGNRPCLAALGLAKKNVPFVVCYAVNSEKLAIGHGR